MAGFTHVQGKNNVGTGTSLSVVLTSTPTVGNLLVVAFYAAPNISNLSIKDANNNAFTITPHSPAVVTSSTSNIYGGYILSAPSNISKTINATWTTTASFDGMFVDEFSGVGTISFDVDAAGSNPAAGTTANTPVLHPTGTGELSYVGVFSGAVSITAPTAGGTLGIWTGAGIDANLNAAEYALSTSGTVTTQMTQGSSATWCGIGMCFALATGGDVITTTHYFELVVG